MRIIFFISEKSHERSLASAFATGAKCQSNIKVDISFDKNISRAADYDAACLIGVKMKKSVRQLFEMEKPFFYFDKGYNRQWDSNNPEWWRVAVNAHQPTEYLLQHSFTYQRAETQKWHPKPWRSAGKHILLAGGSAKYHEFYDLPDPTTWAVEVISKLKEWTDREILYRSKPSWKDAEAVAGAEFKGQAQDNIVNDLKDAHAMITHGSGACLEALLCGIPAIVLGPGITRDISSTTLAEIETPKLAEQHQVNRLLANLAYCQWSLKEINQGVMIPPLMKMLDAAHAL